MATPFDTIDSISATKIEGEVEYLTKEQLKSTIIAASAVELKKLNDRFNPSDKTDTCDETMNFLSGKTGAEESECFLGLLSANKVQEETCRPEIHQADEMTNQAETNLPKKESQLHEENKLQTAEETEHGDTEAEGEKHERTEKESKHHASVAVVVTNCQDIKSEEPTGKVEGEELIGKFHETAGYETSRKDYTTFEAVESLNRDVEPKMEACTKDETTVLQEEMEEKMPRLHDKELDECTSSPDKEKVLEEITGNEEDKEETFESHVAGDATMSIIEASQEVKNSIGGISEIRENSADRLDRELIVCGNNLEIPSLRQTEELYLQKVDNPESVKAIKNEENNAAQADNITRENDDEDEKPEPDRSSKNQDEGIKSSSEVPEASDGERRGTHGLSILSSEENISTTEFIAEHEETGLPIPKEELEDNLQKQKDPIQERLEKSMKEEELEVMYSDRRNTEPAELHKTKGDDTEGAITEEDAPASTCNIDKLFKQHNDHELQDYVERKTFVDTEENELNISGTSEGNITNLLRRPMGKEKNSTFEESEKEAVLPISMAEGPAKEWQDIENEAIRSKEEKDEVHEDKEQNVMETSDYKQITWNNEPDEQIKRSSNTTFEENEGLSSKCEEQMISSKQDGSIQRLNESSENVKKEDACTDETKDNENAKQDDKKLEEFEEKKSTYAPDLVPVWRSNVVQEAGEKEINNVKDHSSESNVIETAEEDSRDDQVYKRSEDAISTKILEKNIMDEDSTTEHSPKLVGEDTETKTVKEEDCSEIYLKEEFKDTNLDFVQQNEITHSIEKTKSEILEKEGTSKDLDVVTATEAVETKTCEMACDENIEDKSAIDSLVLHKDREKEEPTIYDSDFTSVTVETQPEKGQVKCSDLALEGTGSARNEIKEATSYSRDNNVIKGEKFIMEDVENEDIQMVRDESEDTREHQIQHETLKMEDNGKKDNACETNLDDVETDNLPNSSVIPLKEDRQKTAEVSDTTDETRDINEIPDEEVQKHGKEEIHIPHELIIEKNCSEENKDFVYQTEICKPEFLQDYSLGTESEKDESKDESSSNKASRCFDNETSTEAVLEEEEPAKDLGGNLKEGIGAHSHETDIAKTENSGNLKDEQHKRVKKTNEIESVREYAMDEERDINDLETFSVGDETVDQVKASSTVSTEYLEVIDKCEKAALNSEVREDSPKEGEESLEKQLKEDKCAVENQSSETLPEINKIQTAGRSSEFRDQNFKSVEQQIIEQKYQEGEEGTKEDVEPQIVIEYHIDETQTMTETIQTIMLTKKIKASGQVSIAYPNATDSYEKEGTLNSEVEEDPNKKSNKCVEEQMEKEKGFTEMQSNEAFPNTSASPDVEESNEFSNKNSESVEQIIAQRYQECESKTREDVEVQLMEKNQVDGTHRETVKAGTLIKEVEDSSQASTGTVNQELKGTTEDDAYKEREIPHEQQFEEGESIVEHQINEKLLETNNKSINAEGRNDFPDKKFKSVEQQTSRPINYECETKEKADAESQMVDDNQVDGTQCRNEIIQALTFTKEPQERVEEANESEIIVQPTIEEKSDKQDLETAYIGVQPIDEVKDSGEVSTEMVNHNLAANSEVEEDSPKDRKEPVEEELEEDEGFAENQSNETLPEIDNGQVAEENNNLNDSRFAEQQIEQSQEGENEDAEAQLVVEDKIDGTQYEKGNTQAINFTKEVKASCKVSFETFNHELIGTSNSEIEDYPPEEKEKPLEDQWEEDKGIEENQNNKTFLEITNPTNVEQRNDLLDYKSAGQQIIEGRSQEGQKEDVKLQSIDENKVDVTQCDKNTTQAVTLIEEPCEGDANANETEIPIDRKTEEESDKIDPGTIDVGVELLDEVKAPGQMSTQTVDHKLRGNLNSELEEGLLNEKEAPLEEPWEGERGIAESQSDAEAFPQTTRTEVSKNLLDYESVEQEVTGIRSQEDADSQPVDENKVDETREKGTTHAVTLKEEGHEGDEKVNESETSIECLIEEDSDKNDLRKVYDGVESLNEVKASDQISTDTVNHEQAHALFSENEEDPTKVREARYEERLEGAKSVNGERSLHGKKAEKDDAKPQSLDEDIFDGSQCGKDTTQYINLTDAPSEGHRNTHESETSIDHDTEEESNKRDTGMEYVGIESLDEAKASDEVSNLAVNHDLNRALNSEVEEYLSKEKEATLEEQWEKEKEHAENQNNEKLSEATSSEIAEASKKLLEHKFVEQQIIGERSQEVEKEAKQDAESQSVNEDKVDRAQCVQETTQAVTLFEELHEGDAKAKESEISIDHNKEEESDKTYLGIVDVVGVEPPDKDKASYQVSTETVNHELSGNLKLDFEEDPPKETKATLEEQSKEEKGIVKTQNKKIFPETTNIKIEEGSKNLLDDKHLKQNIMGETTEEVENDAKEETPSLDEHKVDGTQCEKGTTQTATLTEEGHEVDEKVNESETSRDHLKEEENDKNNPVMVHIEVEPLNEAKASNQVSIETVDHEKTQALFSESEEDSIKERDDAEEQLEGDKSVKENRSNQMADETTNSNTIQQSNNILDYSSVEQQLNGERSLDGKKEEKYAAEPQSLDEDKFSETQNEKDTTQDVNLTDELSEGHKNAHESETSLDHATEESNKRDTGMEYVVTESLDEVKASEEVSIVAVDHDLTRSLNSEVEEDPSKEKEASLEEQPEEEKGFTENQNNEKLSEATGSEIAEEIKNLLEHKSVEKHIIGERSQEVEKKAKQDIEPQLVDEDKVDRIQCVKDTAQAVTLFEEVKASYPVSTETVNRELRGILNFEVVEDPPKDIEPHLEEQWEEHEGIMETSKEIFLDKTNIKIAEESKNSLDYKHLEQNIIGEDTFKDTEGSLEEQREENKGKSENQSKEIFPETTNSEIAEESKNSLDYKYSEQQIIRETSEEVENDAKEETKSQDEHNVDGTQCEQGTIQTVTLTEEGHGVNEKVHASEASRDPLKEEEYNNPVTVYIEVEPLNEVKASDQVFAETINHGQAQALLPESEKDSINEREVHAEEQLEGDESVAENQSNQMLDETTYSNTTQQSNNILDNNSVGQQFNGERSLDNKKEEKDEAEPQSLDEDKFTGIHCEKDTIQVKLTDEPSEGHKNVHESETSVDHATEESDERDTGMEYVGTESLDEVKASDEISTVAFNHDLTGALNSKVEEDPSKEKEAPLEEQREEEKRLIENQNNEKFSETEIAKGSKKLLEHKSVEQYIIGSREVEKDAKQDTEPQSMDEDNVDRTEFAKGTTQTVTLFGEVKSSNQVPTETVNNRNAHEIETFVDHAIEEIDQRETGMGSFDEVIKSDEVSSLAVNQDLTGALNSEVEEYPFKEKEEPLEEQQEEEKILAENQSIKKFSEATSSEIAEESKKLPEPKSVEQQIIGQKSQEVDKKAKQYEEPPSVDEDNVDRTQCLKETTQAVALFEEVKASDQVCTVNHERRGILSLEVEEDPPKVTQAPLEEQREEDKGITETQNKEIFLDTSNIAIAEESKNSLDYKHLEQNIIGEDTFKDTEASLEEQCEEEKGIVETQIKEIFPETTNIEIAEESKNSLDCKHLGQQIIGETSEEVENDAKVETLSLDEYKVDGTQCEKGITQTLTLTEEVHEVDKKVNESETSRDHLKEKENGKNNTLTVYVEAEPLNEVKASDHVSAKIVNHEQAQALLSESEEDPIKEREVHLEEQIERDRSVAENLNDQMLDETANNNTTQQSNNILDYNSVEEHFNGQISLDGKKEEKDGVEPQSLDEDKFDGTQYEKETTQVVNLTDEPSEGHKNAHESETPIDHVIEESDERDTAMEYFRMETLDEVRASNEVSNLAVNHDLTETLNSEIEEYPSKDKEAPLEEQREEEKGLAENQNNKKFFPETSSEIAEESKKLPKHKYVEQQIIVQRSPEDEKEAKKDADPQQVVEDKVDRTQCLKETTPAITLFEAVKASYQVSTETVNHEQRGILVEVEEDPPKDTEAPLEEQWEEKGITETQSKEIFPDITNREIAEESKNSLDYRHVEEKIIEEDTEASLEEQCQEEKGIVETQSKEIVPETTGIEIAEESKNSLDDKHLEQQIIGQTSKEVENGANEETLSLDEHKVDGAQCEKETTQTVTLTEEGYEVYEKVNESDSKYHLMEEGSNKNDLRTVYVEVEPFHEVQASNQVPIETVDHKQARVLLLESEENPIKERESQVEEQLEGGRGVVENQSNEMLEETTEIRTAQLSNKILDYNSVEQQFNADRTQEGKKEEKDETKPQSVDGSQRDNDTKPSITSIDEVKISDKVSTESVKVSTELVNHQLSGILQTLEEQGEEDKRIAENQSNMVSELSAIDPAHTATESGGWENLDTNKVATSRPSCEILGPKYQDTEGTDVSRESPETKRQDADELEKEIKGTSETISKAQGTYAPADDKSTVDLLAEKLLEEIQSVFPEFISKEEEHKSTTTFQKRDEGHVKEVNMEEDTSATEIIEDACPEKEDDRELNGAKLGHQLTEDLENEITYIGVSRTSEGNPVLQSQESPNEITYLESPTESQNILLVKGTPNPNFNTSLKASETPTEVCSHEEPTKLGDTEIIEKYFEGAAVIDLSKEYIQCDNIIEANQIPSTEVPDEEAQITDTKEVSKDSHHVSLTDIPQENCQEERKAGQEPGEGKNETFMITMTILNEEMFVEASPKESTSCTLEARGIIENIQLQQETSHAKTDLQIPREAYASTKSTSAKEDVLSPLVNPIAEMIKIAEVNDQEPGNAKVVDSEVKDVQNVQKSTTDLGEKETDSMSIDSPKPSLSNLLKRSEAESSQVEQETSEEEIQTRVEQIIQTKEDEKTDEEQGYEHKKMETDSDPPIIVEASKDIDTKAAHKKSHNILSGVSSKVKHSISKVKKVITGKSSHPKTLSPK